MKVMLFDLPDDVREIIWSKLHELKIEERFDDKEIHTLFDKTMMSLFFILGFITAEVFF